MKHHGLALVSELPTDLIGVQNCFRSPRVRHMLQVLWQQKGTAFLDSRCQILDVTQSLHMTGMRSDGLVPTLTCGADLFMPALRRSLDLKELCALMGMHLYESGSEVVVKRMLGNTMHVAAVGSICLAALAATGSGVQGSESVSDAALDSAARASMAAGPVAGGVGLRCGLAPGTAQLHGGLEGSMLLAHSGAASLATTADAATGADNELPPDALC